MILDLLARLQSPPTSASSHPWSFPETAPEDPHPSPLTSVSHCQRDSAGTVKLKSLEMEDHYEMPGRASM